VSVSGPWHFGFWEHDDPAIQTVMTSACAFDFMALVAARSNDLLTHIW
jgi:hypothetical protein